MMNMEYCMFENTYKALKECQNKLDEIGAKQLIAEANEYEKPYIKKLIYLCVVIADENEI